MHIARKHRLDQAQQVQSTLMALLPADKHKAKLLNVLRVTKDWLSVYQSTKHDDGQSKMVPSQTHTVQTETL